MDRGGEVVMPWEHWVCSQCLLENPHAVWLIKLRCFKPHQHHHQIGWTLVSIEPSAMRLVQMRHPPPNIERIDAPIPPWHAWENCPKRGLCLFPHSDVEYHTWDFIRTVFRENTLKKLLQRARLVPQSPTDVCVKCYNGASPFYNTRWLTWLECAKHPEHEGEMGVTLIVGHDHEVVEVLELPCSLSGCSPHELSLCEKMKQPRGCPDEVNCKNAHTIEELEYWKWSLIHKVLEKVPNYSALRERYSYTPNEVWLSATQVGIDQKLSAENYVNKFHHLICLDEIAHCQTMATLCNGMVTVKQHKRYERWNHKEVLMLKLCGMEGAAMDYAVHGHAVVHIPLGQSEIECNVFQRDAVEDALLLHLPNVKMPLLSRNPVYVHFEINHIYFDGLHNAIECLNQHAVSKLFPNETLLKQGTTGKYLTPAEKAAIKEFTLDKEYQINALRRMISSDPRVPFLVIGPFGTGKTRILAAAVSALLCDPKSRILVCTYQHQCANSLYKILFKHYRHCIMRLVPNQQAAKVATYDLSASRQSTNEELGVYLQRYTGINVLLKKKVIVTTFLTATNLKKKETEHQQLHFSHILIDEGAQAREAESLGALAVVKEETKVIIVGDHKQSGPKVAVLSELAQEYELGVSLLERLFNLYKSKRSGGGINNHTASLLTNYRCHSSILAFTSSLFYQHTLLSRSSSETHPLAPYPQVFTCTSIDKNSKNLPAEDRHEARVLVEKLESFVSQWPRSYPKQKVVVLASARKQVELLKKEVTKKGLNRDKPCEVTVIPTYRIQGMEFDAVFISTIEPTKENGEPFDPVRTMSNELVFNTIMTRARSLIYCVGNPFTLCEIGDSRSWKAYLQRCVQCETLQFSIPNQLNRKTEVELATKKLQNSLLPHSVIDEATAVPLTREADKIIKQYMEKLNQRREYKTGCKLVQKPEGRIDWMMEDEQSGDETVILCRLKYSMYNKAIALPVDPSQPPITIKGKENLKGFDGDRVKVDREGRCVLFDDKTERAIRQTHHGESFLCRVSEFNCIQFYPLDKCYPKFVNLPTITREEKRGVVCFDPSSINDTPRVCNVIPHEVALRMVFVVKFLGWKERYDYPLGIIVGAFPSQSQHFQELMLKMKHKIPAAIADHPMEKEPEMSTRNVTERRHFPHAITIDPEGSADHDDALTCTVKVKGERKIYTVGVHITDLYSLVKEGSKLDEQAKQRGCTVYNAPDSICSPMLPNSVLAAASIRPGESIKTFSVLTDFTVTKEGTQKETVQLASVQFLESSVTSQAELTYKEAQDLLVGGTYPQSLKDKIKAYDSQSQGLPLQRLIHYLWKFAWFLRRKRLKEAALAFTVREVDQLKNPEAHYLVEELMIRANTQVARKLSRDFKNKTILRSQKPPDDEVIRKFAETYKRALPLSASCKVLLPNPPQLATASPLLMLKSQHSMLLDNLRNKRFVEVMHCVQMEHLHPQLVALQSRLRSLQSPAQYCVVGEGEDGAHSDLQCTHYTHFTSPLRRYIDVVIQRQLHKVLSRPGGVTVQKVDDQYTEYLKDLCMTTQKGLKKAKEYEKDIESAKFVASLKANQKVYDCIISEMDIKQGRLKLCFTDVELRLGPKASEITTQQLMRNYSTVKKESAESELKMPYLWKVKLCSMNGTPARFLDPAQVETCSQEPDADGKLSFLCLDERNCIMTKRVSVKVKSNVTTVPSRVWQKLQACTMEGPGSIEAHREDILSNLSPVDERTTHIPHREWMSILLVYTLNKELKLFDAMKAQLCATQEKKGLTQEPAIQLLEVGPGLQICVHHNRDPETCFVGKITQYASKEKYNSLTEYVNSWEPLVLTESALTSVKDSELLLIRDVELQWPDFQLCTSSSGDTYYQITKNTRNPENSGIMVTLSKEFMESTHHFIKMSVGDLICMRVSSSDGHTKYVFHMVITTVKMQQGTADVYMKFVLKDSNYISPQVYELIMARKAIYEIQLIHSSLPQRRIYRSLKSISNGTELAQRIALGSSGPQSGNCKRMEKLLSASEVNVARSYWPLKDKRSLNDYQQKAIDLAWKNKFTMIQGPPGTGKSVTGAHIAYALAMRLCAEHSPEKDDKQCVMYCGPTQQSVNVVLDKFIDLLSNSTAVMENVRVIRVFSKGVEKVDFPGPELNKDVFVPTNASAKCEPRHREYALHHKVRRQNSKIVEMEQRFQMMHRQDRIASLHDIGIYNTMISEEEASILTQGVNIILCTCNEAASRRLTNTLQPKYCIIDECAMATEPECMVPIRRAEHVVLIGDHQQLQAVIQSKDAENMGLGKSLFERYATKSQVHVLETQYRMHSAICEFPSKAFYGGRLKTDSSVGRRRCDLDLVHFWPSYRGEEWPIVFCQVEGEEETGHIGSTGSSKVDSKSKFNMTEAKKIVEIAEKLVCHYRVPNSEIAILTPYLAQKEAISEELKKKIEQQKKRRLEQRLKDNIQVKTITESQGSEYGVVLLSTVRSRRMTGGEGETADIDWIRKNLGFVADSHRICVGITRSKFGLVILGNEKVLKYDIIWKKLIKHYKDRRCFRHSSEFPC